MLQELLRDEKTRCEILQVELQLRLPIASLQLFPLRVGKLTLDETEGRVAEAWTRCQGGVHIPAACPWHADGWRVRKEELMAAVLKRKQKKRLNFQKSLDHTV